MAVGQTELDALEKAMAQGKLTVEYDGFRTTFQSADDLLKRISYIKGQMNLQAGRPQRTTQTFATFNRD